MEEVCEIRGRWGDWRLRRDGPWAVVSASAPRSQGPCDVDVGRKAGALNPGLRVANEVSHTTQKGRHSEHETDVCSDLIPPGLFPPQPLHSGAVE